MSADKKTAAKKAAPKAATKTAAAAPPKAKAPAKTAAKPAAKPAAKAPAKAPAKAAAKPAAKASKAPVAKAPAKAPAKVAKAPVVAAAPASNGDIKKKVQAVEATIVTKVRSATKTPKTAAAQPSGAQLRTVAFSYWSPLSQQVDLVGTFNDWRTGEYPLERDDSGLWTTVVDLPVGTYEYRYVFDGTSYEIDPTKETIQGPFGPNNVIVVF